MKIKLLNNTQLPKQGRPNDAGYDLFLNEDITIKYGITVINTGVCVELPPGHAGLLALRSSICQAGFVLQNPLIDENYRGELHAIIFNPTDKIFTYNKGERIYSLYVFPIYHDKLEVVDKLSESNRESNWSGSSGK